MGEQVTDSGVTTDFSRTQNDTDEDSRDDNSYNDDVQLNLDNFKQKDGFVGIQSPESTCENSSTSVSSLPTPSSQGRIKRKKDTKTDILEMIEKRAKERAVILRELVEKKTEQEDDIDAFMRSIALTLKQLTPEKVARAKASILAIVTDLQFPATAPQNATPQWNLYNL